MTTKNLQYIGTDEYYFESAVTGRAQKWAPGQRNAVPNDAAAQLLATGLFRVSPVAAPEYSLDPTTGSVVGLVGPSGSDFLVVSADAPSDADGRPNGTIYIQTA